MKILIVTGAYPPDIGGPATYSALLAHELPARGIEAGVVSYGEVRRYPKALRHIVLACKIIWAGKAADIIFAQDTVSVGFPALIAAHILGKPFIVRVPGDYAWEQATQRFGVADSMDAFQAKKYGVRTELLRRIQRFTVKHADNAIAPSKYFADIVRGWTDRPEKVIHIYNGVDLAEIEASRTPASPSPRTIISAGRLVPWKGFAMLIRSMKKLPDWRLKIAGDGPELARLQAVARETGVESRVEFLGRLPRETLMSEIARSEIFALNTLYETFSFQIVEAMALGMPVIATRVSNLAEIVDDGESGLLIEADNEPQFVDAVKRISGDPAFRAKLATGAHTKAHDFSIEATMSQLIATIDSIRSTAHEDRKRKDFAAKIVRYLFSGGIAAITNLALLWLFTSVIHIWYLLSSILAFMIAFGVSFVLQKFFTYQDHSTQGMKGQALTYLLVTGTNLALNTGLMYLAVDKAHMNYILAQIVVSIVIAIESYVIYGIFIFKK